MRCRLLPHIKDDAGKPVRVLDGATLEELPVSSDARVWYLARRVTAAYMKWTWDQSLVGLAVFTPAIALFILLHWLRARGITHLPSMGVLIACAPLAVFASWFMRKYQFRRKGGEIVRIMLEEGFCACCGYNLHGVPIAEGEMLVCPECGASWKRSRVVRSEPVASAKQNQGNAAVSFMDATSGGFSTWRSNDSRGAAIELVQPRLRRELKNALDDDHRDRLLAARKQIAPNGRTLRILIGCLLIAIGVIGTWTFMQTATPGVPWIVRLAPLLLSLLGVAALRANFLYSPARVRWAMLQQHLCPCCTGFLDGLVPEADGCVVCDTCRAAWRVSPPTERPGVAIAGEGMR